jgi:hypothetical protein
MGNLDPEPAQHRRQPAQPAAEVMSHARPIDRQAPGVLLAGDRLEQRRVQDRNRGLGLGTVVHVLDHRGGDGIELERQPDRGILVPLVG